MNQDEQEQIVDNEGNTGDKPMDALGNTPEGMSEAVENVDKAVDNTAHDVDETANYPQKTVETAAESVHEAETTVDEAVDTVDNYPAEPDRPATKTGGGSWWKILLGLVAFVGILACVWIATDGGAAKNKTLPITYVKDNALYLYDLKNEPQLLDASISDGAEYHYYYSAWGATITEQGKDLFYLAEMDSEGIGKLYHKNLHNAKDAPVLIAENVMHYIIAQTGRQCAYLALDENGLSLYAYADGESYKITDDILQMNGVYDISADGSFVVYKLEEETGTAFYISAIGENAQSTKLSDNVAADYMRSEGGSGFYLEEQNGSYNLYEYRLNEAPRLVAERVTYAEMLPNGVDFLYCAMQKENTPLTQLVEDDVTDLSIYDEERQAVITEIRHTMEQEGEMEPIFQDCFVVTQEGEIPLLREVMSATPALGDGSYVVGYKMEAPEPAKLSEINSFDEALYSYYMALMTGESELVITGAEKGLYALQGENIDPNTIEISADGERAAYIVADAATGEAVLMTEALGSAEKPVEIAKNVDAFYFLGDTQELVFIYDYNVGMGRLGSYDGEEMHEIDENVIGMQAASDAAVIYYIADMHSETGNGTLVSYDGGNIVEMDDNTFAFHYKGDGKLAYIRDYSLAEGMGDLYYFDGSQSTEVDTEITAIYMY